jgi:hypothetical protein
MGQHGRRSAVRLVLLGALVTALAVPLTAQGGVITIGSNLAREPDIHFDCSLSSSACTVFQTVLPDGSHAAFVESPVNGTITQWRIRSTSTGNSAVALRVRKSAGSLLYTGGGTSATVTPPASAITPYPTQLPIGVGDEIGLNFIDDARYFVVNTGATASRFDPALADGDPGRPSTGRVDNREVAINADIVPSSTIGALRAKAGSGGEVKLSMEIPNPGTIVVASAKSKGRKAVASAKRRRLLKPASGEVGSVIGSSRSFSLDLEPTKAAKSLLAAGIRPKAKLKVTFTVNPHFGGGSSSQTVKVKLKR